MREPAEVVREAMEAFRAGDLRRALAQLAPDVEWDNRGVNAPGLEQVYLGHEGVLALIAGLFDVFAAYTVRDPSFEAVGDRVLVMAREFGRGIASGIEDNRPLALLYTVRDGLIVAVSTYSDVEDARRRFAES